jgi:hypothetical protein
MRSVDMSSLWHAGDPPTGRQFGAMTAMPWPLVRACRVRDGGAGCSRPQGADAVQTAVRPPGATTYRCESPAAAPGIVGAGAAPVVGGVVAFALGASG